MRPERRRNVFAAGALLLAAFAGNARADAYNDARAELIAAYQAQNYAAMRAAAERALEARPGFAGGLFNLALARTLAGDPAGALTALEALLAQNVDLGAAGLAEFEPLHALPGWDDYAARAAALSSAIGDAQVAYRYLPGDFVPEGIAVDPEGGVYLGSIRNGAIVHVDYDARVVTRPGPHWSVFGMRLHDGRLWFVSSAIEQLEPRDLEDAGRNGLFSVDPAGGDARLEFELPRNDRRQVLGDLAFDSEGNVYLADQTDGIVYRLDAQTRMLSELVPKGTLGSPQGMVLDATGSYLYVADYIGGLFRVTLADGEVLRLSTDPATNAYGIDGLYRHGRDLIAIQNGIRPNRVARLYLSDDGRAVAGSRILAMNLPDFDEPNLGQVDGDRFLFIANSHWNRFDDDANLPEGLTGPIVLELGLDTTEE